MEVHRKLRTDSYAPSLTARITFDKLETSQNAEPPATSASRSNDRTVTDGTTGPPQLLALPVGIYQFPPKAMSASDARRKSPGAVHEPAEPHDAREQNDIRPRNGNLTEKENQTEKENLAPFPDQSQIR